MPSFFDASAATWAGMRASTHIGTYAILEDLCDNGSKAEANLRDDLRECLPNLIEAGWVARSGGQITITEAGTRHLRSF